MLRADTPEPPVLLRLRGSQAQMGAQLGELLRELGGYQQVLEFYPRMASAMLSLAVPHPLRASARRAWQRALLLGAEGLDRARRRRFPEYAARTDAMLRAAGLPRRFARALTVMDVLQNAVGGFGRLGLLETTGLQVAAIPACTSLAVWGEGSSDGQLRHARNFDFPGAGVWDRTPKVVLCEPDEGLRYGFVSTRGADTPGITAFNEAGLSLTIHTRFHRDINFSGVGVIDFGHQLIRSCRNLAQVRERAATMQTASTWGLLVSSAQERRALIVETTGAAVRTVEAGAEALHLAQANRYLHPQLRPGEVSSSASFVIDSDARYARADGARARHGGQLSREDLEGLLGDCGDPGAPDPEAEDRLGGNCIVSAMTVKSVVFEPEASRVRLSIGPAPTGLGPWVDVPYAWDGPVGRVGFELPPPAPAAPPSPRSSRAAAMRGYVAVTRAHFEGAGPVEVRAMLERLVAAAPSEPNYRFLAAIFAVVVGDFAGASKHLDRALAREQGPYRRALCLLWQARVLSACRDEDGAARARRQLIAVHAVPGVANLQAAAARESTRPLSRLRLRTVVPDVMLIDAVIPGVGV